MLKILEDRLVLLNLQKVRYFYLQLQNFNILIKIKIIFQNCHKINKFKYKNAIIIKLKKVFMIEYLILVYFYLNYLHIKTVKNYLGMNLKMNWII